MKRVVKRIRWLAFITLSLGVLACSDKSDVANISMSEEPVVDRIFLDVYKSPTCTCCDKWVTYVEAAGFEVAVHQPTDLNKIKVNKKILPRYQSCHTSVSKDGYVFEGHVPTNVIQRFIANPPSDAIGLAVPGMPVGSPGMEIGNRHDAYDVLVLRKNGGSEVFEHIDRVH